MILNNSGIVHCTTRTRGREETAMNMQELLTYVEELTFKTSMFGYDKDEVDIQLDKICDEAEAIILAKEKEIEELKKESKTALGIAAAATGKTMEELEQDTKEDIVEAEEQAEETETEETTGTQEEASETVSSESPMSTVAVANADEAQDEIEAVKAQLIAAQKKVEALEAELQEEKAKAEAAVAQAEEAAKSAGDNKAPQTTDQAYERYMKNADLLCQQLSDLEGRQNAILDEAREQAEREREKARQDAADIIGEARKTAERLLKDAQEDKENAIEEAKKIHEDSLRKVEEEKKQCDELAAQKKAMVNSLKKLTEDTARLMEKMQG